MKLVFNLQVFVDMYRSKNKITSLASLLLYVASVVLLAPASVFCFDSDRHYAVEFELVGCVPTVEKSNFTVDQELSGLCCVPSSSSDTSCNDVTVHGTILKSNNRAPRADNSLGLEKNRPTWNIVANLPFGNSLLDREYRSLQSSLILKQVRTVILIQ